LLDKGFTAMGDTKSWQQLLLCDLDFRRSPVQTISCAYSQQMDPCTHAVHWSRIQNCEQQHLFDS